jgi:hypothetical protein
MCTDTMKCVSNNTKKKKSFSEFFKKEELTERETMWHVGGLEEIRNPPSSRALFSSSFFSALFNFFVSELLDDNFKNSFFLLFYKRKRVFSLIILSSLKNKLTAFLNDGQSKVQGLIKFCFFFGEIFQCRPCFSRCFLVCVCV